MFEEQQEEDIFSIHDFEELLSLDDIFVDYFNEFLKCNVFPQKIYYDRDLHTFVEKKDENNNYNIEKHGVDNDDDKLFQFDDIKINDNTKTKTFDKVRQVQMIQWAMKERLKLFWCTELYRQYKLCKQILRPWTIDKYTSLYSSQDIGGYSHTSVYTSQISLSTEYSDTDYTDQVHNNTSRSNNNNSSDTNAIFEDLLMALELRMPKVFLRPERRAHSVPVYVENTKTMHTKSADSKLFNISKRSSSSKTSEKISKSIALKETTTTMASLCEDSHITQPPFVPEDELYLWNINDMIGDDDEEILNFELENSIEQLKFKYLGSHSNMQNFIQFLKSTNGYDLYRFWMDCEFYKDTMKGLDKNSVPYTRLFRDLNEKYHFPFMCHLKNKIRTFYRKNQNGSLTDDSFLQFQYDILRRLRIYWCSRYITHQLFIHNYHSKNKISNVCLYPIDNKIVSKLADMTQVFLSNDYTNNKIHINNLILNYKQKSIKLELDRLFSTKFMKIFYKSIQQDKIAGGLFLRYIAYNEQHLLSLILFCYDVDDFRYSDLDDKVFEGQHALSIINTYFGNSAKLSLDKYLPNVDIQTMRICIQMYEFNKLFFEILYKQVLIFLKDPWLRCLKFDIDQLTMAYYLLVEEKNRNNEDEIEDNKEIVQNTMNYNNQVKKSELNVSFRIQSSNTEMKIINDTVYVKRPWVEQYLSSTTIEQQQQQQCLIKIIDLPLITDEERERIRLERLERLTKMKIARKKALKAARQRQRLEADAKRLLNRLRTSTNLNTGNVLHIDCILNASTLSSNNNKRPLLNYFQRYLKLKNIKLNNKLALIFDIIKFMNTTNDLNKRQILDKIKKLYFNSQSERTILPVNEKLTKQLNNDQFNPSFLRLVYKELRYELEGEFVLFCEDCTKEFQIQSLKEFLSKSNTELVMLFNESSNYSTSESNKFDDDDEDKTEVDEYDENNDGKRKPKKKHLTELMNLIQDEAIGKYNPQFFYFYAYLTHFINKDETPYLDRDLLFCIDVLRMKQITNNAILQAKLKYILETYLSSPTIQIDLINDELNMRMIKSLQKAIQSNIHEYSAFDHARIQLIKEKLVFYYAGFKNYLFYQNSKNNHLTKKSNFPILKTTIHPNMNIKQKSTNNVLLTELKENKQQMKQKSSTYTSITQTILKHSTSTPPQDLTTMTKTQRVLDARMDEFQRIKLPKVTDVQFPKKTQMMEKYAQNNDEKDQSNSVNSKHGCVLINYTLTGGLKVKVIDKDKPDITFVNVNNNATTDISFQQDNVTITAPVYEEAITNFDQSFS